MTSNKPRHLAGQDVETAAQREIFETEQGYADRLLEAVQQDDYELAYTIVANEQVQFLRVGRVLSEGRCG